MANDLDLQTQLQEKDELVAALTERLELAAEQLDRLHRIGADRGARIGGGGFPPELIEQHETLVDDLQEAVRQWQGMQTGLVLGNLQTQVAELHEMIASGVNPGTALRPARSDDGPVLSEDDLAGDRSAEEDESSRWDALKSYLLDEDHVPEAAPESDAGEEAEAGSETDRPEESPSNEPIESVDPPEPVDPRTADEAVLWSAIESRDEYIAFLMRKLRYAKPHTPLPVNWAEWESMPQELCQQVEQLQSQLNEKLRLSELELSLERARLAREEVRIRQMEDNARRTMRQLGIDPESDGDEDRELEPDAGNGNRWLRMLGLRRDSDDEDDDE